MKTLSRILLALCLCGSARAASSYIAGFPQGTTTTGLPQALNGAAVSTASPSYSATTIEPFSMTLAGALRVDSSAVTQPVSIATMPALVAGSANIGHVDGQGTAGTPTGGVVTIQGVASGTVVPVSGTVTVNGIPTSQGQAAAASSAPVALANEDIQDMYFPGAAAQTATVNNIIPSSSGAASTDATGYRSGSVQIVSTGTGGTYIFETCDDNASFQAMAVFDASAPSTMIQAAITPGATQKIFTFPITARYIRVRIASTITGGSIQAFTSLRQTTWSPSANAVNIAFLGAGAIPVTGGAISTHPVPVAAGTLSTLPSAAIANGLSENLAMTSDQQLIVHQDGDPSNEWSATSGLSAFTSTASTTLKAAGGAGIRNYVTGIQITNTTTTQTTVTILDGAAVIWAMSLPATSTTLPALPVTITFRTALKGTAATAMNIQQSAAGNLWYNVQGFQNN